VGDDKSISLLAGLVNKSLDEEGAAAADKALLAVATRAAGNPAAVDTLVAAMAGAGSPGKQSILGALRRTGSPKGLVAVRAAVTDKDAAVQDAAVRALAEWPDTAAINDLVAIAENDPKASNQVLAIRGLVRVVELPGVTPDRQIAILTKAMTAAKRPEDKKLVLGGLGKLKAIEALRLAAPLMADDGLKEEAATAATQIAKAMPSPLPAEVKPMLEKAAQVTTNNRTRKDAQDLLAKMPK
jgi:hypothetical protein